MPSARTTFLAVVSVAGIGIALGASGAPPAPASDSPAAMLALGSRPARTKSDVTGEDLRERRARFAASMADAVLLGFQDAASTVLFRPAKAADPDHQPGPLEDAVIASAVRGNIARDAHLQHLKIGVVSSAGHVQLNGEPENGPQAAALLHAALIVDQVQTVQVDLPPELR